MRHSTKQKLIQNRKPLSDKEKLQIRTLYSNRIKPKLGAPLKRRRHHTALMTEIKDKHIAVLPDIRVDHPGLYTQGKYTPGDKIAAVIAFQATGNCKQASEFCSVPPTTISSWRREEWWGVVDLQIKQEKNQELDNRYTEILDALSGNILQRATEGDPIVNTKTGAIVGYRPPSLRDTSIAMGVVQDKRALLRGDATSITKKEVSVDDRLQKLTTKFKEVAEKDGVLIEGEKE